MSKLRPISLSMIGHGSISTGSYLNTDGFDVSKDPTVVAAVAASTKANEVVPLKLDVLTKLIEQRRLLVDELAHASALRDRANFIANWYAQNKNRTEGAPGIFDTSNWFYVMYYDENTFVVPGGSPFAYQPAAVRNLLWGKASAGATTWTLKANEISAKIATLDGSVTNPASIAYADKVYKDAQATAANAFSNIAVAKATAMKNYQDSANTDQRTKIPYSDLSRIETEKAIVDANIAAGVASMRNKKILVVGGVVVAAVAVVIGGLVLLKA